MFDDISENNDDTNDTLEVVFDDISENNDNNNANETLEVIYLMTSQKTMTTLIVETLDGNSKDISEKN